jgi:MCP family monocarboxylic acid transporter-like MFS transporter 10
MFILVNIPQRIEPQLKSKSLQSRLKEFVNVSIWKKKQYVLWACSIPLALFG